MAARSRLDTVRAACDGLAPGLAKRRRFGLARIVRMDRDHDFRAWTVYSGVHHLPGASPYTLGPSGALPPRPDHSRYDPDSASSPASEVGLVNLHPQYTWDD